MVGPLVDWIVWYADGSTFTSAQGEPKDSPKFGVIAVAQADAWLGHEVMTGEWYVYRADVRKWFFCDSFGVKDQMIHFGHVIGAVRPGRFVTNDEYAAILKTTFDDPRLPRRSALKPLPRGQG